MCHAQRPLTCRVLAWQNDQRPKRPPSFAGVRAAPAGRHIEVTASGDEAGRRWDNKGHFFAAAAEAMRRILIDRARAKGTGKRGGGRARVSLAADQITLDAVPQEILDLDEALGRLAEEDPSKAFAERFVLSIKSECLNRLVILGERHLRRAVAEFVEHYHLERPHQGLGNRVIEGVPELASERVVRPVRVTGRQADHGEADDPAQEADRSTDIPAEIPLHWADISHLTFARLHGRAVSLQYNAPDGAWTRDSAPVGGSVRDVSPE